MTTRSAQLGLAASVLAMMAGGAAADSWTPSYTLYGTPGLVEMPTANGMRDGMIAATGAHMGNHDRLQLSFQVTPRLTATFRHALINNATGPGTKRETYRGFDLQYRLLDEGNVTPSVAVGLRDFTTPGRYGAEYVVATKTIGKNLQVSGGVGWGALGSRSSLFSTGTRPASAGQGGVPAYRQWFRGPASFFGGVEYQLSPSWRVKAEYSSDNYSTDAALGTFSAKNPFNFGVTYSPNRHVQVGAQYLQGKEFGVTATFLLNPNSAYLFRGADSAPVPVGIPAPDAAAAASWTGGAAYDQSMAPLLASALKNEGVTLLGLQTSGNSMRVRYENTQYRAEAQAMGRISRILSQIAPAGVTEFRLEPVTRGLAKSSLVIQRSDLVVLENEIGAADNLWARIRIDDAAGAGGLTAPTSEAKRFGWGIAPYVEFGGGDDAFLYQGGLAASATYDITPNLVLSGEVRQRIFGNEKKTTVTNPTPANSRFPVVRRDAGDYLLARGPRVQHLTLTHLGKLAPNVYTKVTGGYLETMYGGVGAELLWKPADSRLALGLELGYGVKRKTRGLGFQNERRLTGIASAYYEFDNDFVARADAGRYLAGDWGGKLSLSREFPNGWKVGGYVSKTNMTSNEYGAGSFDKGVTVTIPMNWLLGTPTRKTRSVNLHSQLRDGAQQLELGDDLYDIVRDGHRKDLQDSWGRFWK